jgi:hypothetical protein
LGGEAWLEASSDMEDVSFGGLVLRLGLRSTLPTT